MDFGRSPPRQEYAKRILTAVPDPKVCALGRLQCVEPGSRSLDEYFGIQSSVGFVLGRERIISRMHVKGSHVERERNLRQTRLQELKTNCNWSRESARIQIHFTEPLPLSG